MTSTASSPSPLFDPARVVWVRTVLHGRPASAGPQVQRLTTEQAKAAMLADGGITPRKVAGRIRSHRGIWSDMASYEPRYPVRRVLTGRRCLGRLDDRCTRKMLGL